MHEQVARTICSAGVGGEPGQKTTPAPRQRRSFFKTMIRHPIPNDEGIQTTIWRRRQARAKPTLEDFQANTESFGAVGIAQQWLGMG